MNFLLHTDHTSHEGVFHFLTDRLGRFGLFLEEVVWHGFIDTLKLVLFLFLTYLLIRLLHRPVHLGAVLQKDHQGWRVCRYSGWPAHRWRRYPCDLPHLRFLCRRSQSLYRKSHNARYSYSRIFIHLG